MVFYFNVLLCHVFPCKVHSHLYFGWCLTRQLTLFLAETVVLVRLTWLRLGFTSAHFWKVPHLFTGVTFLVQCRTRLATVWLTSTSITQVTIAFITSELFYRFSEGLFEVVSLFFFYYIWSITCWGTRKAIAWLLNCKLSVISDRDIVGLVLMLSNSLNFASGSLKPEINFIFTNSSSWLVTVF